MQSVETLLSPKLWAQEIFGEVELGDPRRGRRAVRMAEALARDPGVSFPREMTQQRDLQAAYRFLDSAHVSYEDLLRPCFEHARQEACEGGPVVLLLQDATECDQSKHPTTTGLGPIGNGSQHGFFVQSVLAVKPSTREVLGLLHQEAFLRQPAPKGESSRQRLQRERETLVWTRSVQAIGSPPASVRWVHVGDRGSDLFPLLTHIGELGCDFTIRACKDRGVDLLVEPGSPPPTARCHHRQAEQAPRQYLFEVVRGWPEQACLCFELETTQRRPGRTVHAAVSWGQVRLLVPRDLEAQKMKPLVVWVVRVWEQNASEEVEPLEWVLLTSVPVQTAEQALERIEWYRQRWIIEDYHQGLKTGCRLEERHLHDYASLQRLLGLLAPVAVRLLQLRALARMVPEAPALQVLPRELVVVVAHLSRVEAQEMSVQDCWHALARQGGYLGRKGDGPPGWKTLWYGWQKVQTILEGIHLSALLSTQLNL
jgi:hypothetical protein